MKILNYLTILILSCFSLVTLGQETIIKGKVEGFENEKIKLDFHEDYLTFTKGEIDQMSIEEGAFQFAFELKETTQIIIRIEDKETSIFAEPGKVYNIYLSYNEETNRGNAFDKLLELQFPFPQKTNINLQIKEFNQDYQDFFADHYRLFMINAANKELSAFIAKWDEKMKAVENDFVASYIRYAVGSMEILNKVPKEKLYKKYIENQPILHQHKEYMNFFSQMYQSDFEQLVITKEGTELMKAIMYDHDLEKSRSLVRKLKGFFSPELAELYLIKGLYDVYHKKTVEQKSNIILLEKISKNGLHSNHKLLAENCINQLKQFGVSAEPPSFELENEKGELISLSDFKGKIVYLQFWANWSLPSLRQMKVMQKLNEKYGDKIAFISVNMDDEKEIFKNEKSKNNYQWTFLHLGNDYEIRERFGLQTLPSYFLIDEKGHFIRAFAKDPSQIEKELYELSK